MYHTYYIALWNIFCHRTTTRVSNKNTINNQPCLKCLEGGMLYIAYLWEVPWDPCPRRWPPPKWSFFNVNGQQVAIGFPSPPLLWVRVGAKKSGRSTSGSLQKAILYTQILAEWTRDQTRWSESVNIITAPLGTLSEKRVQKQHQGRLLWHHGSPLQFVKATNILVKKIMPTLRQQKSIDQWPENNLYKWTVIYLWIPLSTLTDGKPSFLVIFNI